MIHGLSAISVTPHPTNIPGDKKLFIDATDPKAFTTVSGDIEVAKDKFVFADFTQSVAMDRPTLDLANKEINFNNTTNHLTSGANYIFSTSNGLSIFALLKTDDDETNRKFIDFGNTIGRGYGVTYTRRSITASSSTSFGGAANSVVIADSTEYRRVSFIIEFGNNQKIYSDNVEVASSNITLSQLTANEIRQNPTRILLDGPVTIGIQSRTDNDADRFYGKKLRAIIIYATFIQSFHRKLLDMYFQILKAR